MRLTGLAWGEVKVSWLRVRGCKFQSVCFRKANDVDHWQTRPLVSLSKVKMPLWNLTQHDDRGGDLMADGQDICAEL